MGTGLPALEMRPADPAMRLSERALLEVIESMAEGLVLYVQVDDEWIAAKRGGRHVWCSPRLPIAILAALRGES